MGVTNGSHDGGIPVMDVRGIRVAIGDKMLLDGVDLRLPAGKVTALLGPNGAGKSTFLKVMAGSLKPDAGEVRLNGTPLPDWTGLQCARMRAVLLQDHHLPFAFTVEEVAIMGRYPHVRHRETARDRAVVRSCLAATDMLPLAGRLYPTLSGGEKQRTQWARALAQLDPGDMRGKCLLLDEPTSSLDLAHQHSLLERARLLAAAGAGVLVVLHDLNLAAQYADVMALMREGRIVAVGKAEAVMVPEILNGIYGVDAGVIPHPDHGKPWMFVRSPPGPVQRPFPQEEPPPSRVYGKPEAPLPHASFTPHSFTKNVPARAGRHQGVES